MAHDKAAQFIRYGDEICRRQPTQVGRAIDGFKQGIMAGRIFHSPAVYTDPAMRWQRKKAAVADLHQTRAADMML